MSCYLDNRLVKFCQYLGDRSQHVEECGAQVRAVRCEGHMSRHIQSNVVANARNADACSLEFRPKLGLLAIHVPADCATGNRAHTCQDHCMLATLNCIITRCQADNRTGNRANDGTLRRAACL